MLTGNIIIHGLVMSAIPIGGVMGSLSDGHLYTAIFDNASDQYAWIESLSNNSDKQITFLSRVPESRLQKDLDLTLVRSFWISNKADKEGILLKHTSINEFIENNLPNVPTIFVIEGLEWLVSESGQRNTLRHMMNIKDYIYDKQVAIIYALQTNTIDEEILDKISRQAPFLDVSHEVLSDEEQSPSIENNELDTVVIEEEQPLIPYLTTLPFEGFSHKILRKRILQWRRLGVDVSDCEPGIFCEDIGQSHSIYVRVDEKVREATELLNIMDKMRSSITKSEFTVMEFRLRQLTGMDEVSNKLKLIIGELSES